MFIWQGSVLVRLRIIVTIIQPYLYFLHDRSWISPWIKSISNELDIINHVIASQLSGHCDIISNRLWRHQQNEKRATGTRGRGVKIVVLSSFMEPLCRVRNKIMYVLSRRIVSALPRVLILFSMYPWWRIESLPPFSFLQSLRSNPDR